MDNEEAPILPGALQAHVSPRHVDPPETRIRTFSTFMHSGEPVFPSPDTGDRPSTVRMVQSAL